MARRFYTLLVFLLLPWALAHLLWRARRQPQYLRHWHERFGHYDSDTPGPIIWIHAVSVGETRAAQPLVAALTESYPKHRILFTHMTPTGRATSEALFGDSVLRVYLPYDTPGAVARFLDHFRPAIGLIMETEIWPNLVRACKSRGIALLLVNARLSERSASRYARYRALTRQALAGLAAIAAQGEQDAARLTALGAPDVKVSGNMKFDITPPEAQLALGEKLRSLWLGPNRRPILLAASTREGEEALILDALARRAPNDWLLVIVPRHPQRFDAVAALAAARGFEVARRSDEAPVEPQTRVLIGDSMGEMFAYYAACDIAFIGGSLLDYGSQNLIEACAVGAPLLVGPSTFNFAEAAEQAQICGAARSVADADRLLAAAAELFGDDDTRESMATAGRAFASHHRGASRRTLALIEDYLPIAAAR